MNGKKNKSIRQKLMRTFSITIIVVILCSFLASQISVNVFKTQSTEQAREQALTSAWLITDGMASNIGEQLGGLTDRLIHAADFIEYVYAHEDEFSPRSIPTPDEVPDAAVGNVLHWLPFEKEEANDPAIVAEANVLAAVESEFQAIMDTSEMVISLYIATNTHVNIGFDASVMSKRDIGAYNPQTAGAKWYKNALKTGEIYISDTYDDTFGRGLTITVAAPFRVDGQLRGVVAGDVIIQNINELMTDMDTGYEDGYAMLFTKSGLPICAPGLQKDTQAASLLGGAKNVQSIVLENTGILETAIRGQDVFVFFQTVEGTNWVLTLVIPSESVMAPVQDTIKMVNRVNLIIGAVTILIILAAVAAVSRLCRSLTSPLVELSSDVEKIGEGDLDYTSNIHTGDEIEALSHSFQSMTVSLKTYIENITAITAEKERIGAELDVAAHIQSSMLPCIFPAFPDRKEIDIYATMNPAKEVGGDFYDFFMVDERHVAIVMADVSGKGVPAALFMVIGKTLIKDHTQAGTTPGEVFSTVNNMLCEANSEGLFITAFMGVLDMVTGEFVYVNAGHEMPFICKKGETFKPYKIKPGFVLAGMEDMRYRSGSLTLEPGDKILQYTDGVTEATNAHNELYGMERLENFLATVSDKQPADILPALKADIDGFVGEAPQFDDITMLCLEYRERMKLDEQQPDDNGLL